LASPTGIGIPVPIVTGSLCDRGAPHITRNTTAQWRPYKKLNHRQLTGDRYQQMH
jgi:hypothetical protein